MEPEEHRPNDPRCVMPGDKVKGARKCQICAKYDGAVWLTQWEMVNDF